MDTLELIPDAEANTPLVANGAHTPVLAEVKPLVTVRAPVGLTLALLATVGTIASSTRAAHRTTALNAQPPPPSGLTAGHPPSSSPTPA